MRRKLFFISLIIAFAGSLTAQTSRLANMPRKVSPVLVSKQTRNLQKINPENLIISDQNTLTLPKISNMLKASKVTNVIPTALFQRPVGTYIPTFIGASKPEDLGYSYSFSGIAGSAYSKPWVFRNLSTNATGYQWSWGDVVSYSTEKDVSIVEEGENYLTSGWLYPPKLKALNGADSAVYQLPNAGQETGVLFSSSDIMYVGNADMFGNASEIGDGGASVYTISASNSTQLNGSGTGYYWGSCLRNQDGTNGTVVESVISIYEKPMSPLTVKDICYFGITTAGTTPVPVNKALKATIIKLTAEGTLTNDTIATATLLGSDVKIEEGTTSRYVYLPFTFVETDPETGREAAVTPVISDAFAIVLSGLSQSGVNFGLFSDYKNTIESTSYYTKNDAVTGANDGKMYRSSSTGMNVYLTMNSYFNYMYCIPDTKVLDAPVEGGEAVDPVYKESGALIYTFFYDTQDSITSEDLIWLKSSMPDWIELSYTAEYYADYGFLVFIFDAQPLPQGIVERSADITFESYGAEETVTIQQGVRTGVKSLKKNDINMVKTNQGYKLNYTNDYSTAKLYTLSGQHIETFELPTSGEYMLNMNKLAKGIYFVEFNGDKKQILKVLN